MRARKKMKTETNGRGPCLEMISEAELRDLITREAEMIGLDFEKAVKRAKKGTLPRNAIGDDLSLLVQLLPA